MTTAVTFTLPEPPSSNRYWRHGNGVVYRSSHARAYIGDVFQACISQGVTPSTRWMWEPVALSIDWYRSARRGDLDNRAKIVLDALEGLVYENDSQLVELHLYRREDKKNPRVVVTARALPADCAAPLRSD